MKKRVLSLLLAALMLVSLLPTVGITAAAASDTYTISSIADPEDGVNTVTFSVGGNEVTEAAAGEAVTVVVDPSTGHEVTGITAYKTDDEETTVEVSENTFTMPEYPVTVKIETGLKTYTITAQADPAEGGSVTGGGTYEYGEPVSLTATHNKGYKFVQWNDGDTENPRSITVANDAAYTAVFESTAVSYQAYNSETKTFSAASCTATGGSLAAGIGKGMGASSNESLTVAEGMTIKAGASADAAVTKTAADALGQAYVHVEKASPVAFVDLNGNGTFDEATEKKYDTVQEAINAAAAAQGVTNLETAKTVVLLTDATENIAVQSAQTVILDLNGKVLKAKAASSVIAVAGRLKIIDSDPTAIHKFDKTNACWSLAENTATGEKIVTVTGGVITGGSGYSYLNSKVGGGIFILQGTVHINGGNIVGNAAKLGGGIFSILGTVNATDCAFSGNNAEIGGGIFLYSGSPAAITDCIVSDNSVSANGGGIFLYSGTVTTTDCTVSNNSAENGGGIFLNSGSSAIITDCTVSNNSATNGGGIYNNYATATITGCTVSDNSSATYGGGIDNDHGTVTITGCTVSGNSASNEGGGINNVGTLTIADTSVTGNTLSGQGGQGGGIATFGKLYLKDKTAITGNTNNGDYPSAGVYCWIEDSSNCVNIEGKVIIKDNTTKGAPANLCLSNNGRAILGTLSSGSDIRVTTMDNNDAVKMLPFTTNGNEADAAYFTSDVLTYKVKYVAATTVPAVAAHLELALKEATIDETYYNTLAEAIAEAEDGETVKLMCDLTPTETITINIDKGIALNMDNHKVTSTADTAILVTGGQVSLYDGKVTGQRTAVAATGKDTQVSIEGGEYTNASTGNVTVLHAINDAMIYINGATVTGKSADGEKTAKVFYSGVNYEDNSNSETPGLIRVTGGEFTGRLSTSNWGRYEITGGTFDTNEVQNYINPVDADGKPTGTSVKNTETPTVTLDDSGMLRYSYTAQQKEGTDFYEIVSQRTYGVSLKANVLAGVFFTDRGRYVAGDTVVVHCDCNDYYEVASVSVKPDGGEAAALTAEDGVYSFEMPEKAVQITVTVKAKAAKGTFGSVITKEINAFGDFVSPAAVEAALEELLNNTSAANLKLFYKNGLDFDTFGAQKVADFLTELVGSGTVKQELLQRFPEGQRKDCENILYVMSKSDVIVKMTSKLNEVMQTGDNSKIIYAVMSLYPIFVDEYKRCDEVASADLPVDVFLSTVMNESYLDLAECVVINIMASEDAIVDYASTDFMGAVLNSDVLFKAYAKMLEALQTGNFMTGLTTYLSLIPKIQAEIDRANGEEEVTTVDTTLAKLVARLNDGKNGKVSSNCALICDKVYRLMKNTAVPFTEDECKAAYNTAAAFLNVQYAEDPTITIKKAIGNYAASLTTPGKQDALVALMLMADYYDYAMFSGNSENSMADIIKGVLNSDVFMERIAVVAGAADADALVNALLKNTPKMIDEWIDEVGKLGGNELTVDDVLTFLKRPLDLTVTGSADNAFAWTGEAFDTANLTVVAKLNGTPVTDVSAYDYTFYPASDESMETALEAPPTAVGAYQVVVSVSEDDGNYLGTSEAYSFLIKPVIKQVNADTQPGDNVNYTQLKDTTITIHSSAEFKDFLEVRVSANGGEAQVLDSENYTAEQGSIKVTLKEEYLNSLTPGTYVFSVISGINTAESGDPVWLQKEAQRIEFSADITVTVYDGCKYTVCFGEGENVMLLLGGKEAGKYTIAKVSGGYTIYDGTQYIALSSDGKTIVKTAEAYKWKFDGGLYGEIKSTTRGGFRPGKWNSPKTTKVYLNQGTDGLTVSSKRVTAQLQATDSHEWLYKDNHDGATHKVYCAHCNKVQSKTAGHVYDDTTHKCACGAIDPDFCKVIGVKVTEKKTTANGGRKFRAKKITKYQYTIKPETLNVGVKKVQYSGNGRKWSTGTAFTSDTKLSEFYIRVTDSKGMVTNWVYKDGNVSNVSR